MENKTIDDCLHKHVYYIGNQEPVNDIPGFPIGNCIKCESTINIQDYIQHTLAYRIYKGERVPIYRKYDSRMR